VPVLPGLRTDLGKSLSGIGLDSYNTLCRLFFERIDFGGAMAGEIHAVGDAKLARISWYSARRPARRQSYAFPAGAVVAIGRSVDQQIMLDDESVSRSHARLEIGHGTVLFKDLGSSNGSFLDGAQKIEQLEWQPGQRIHIAAYIRA
jgi:FHA domain